MRITPFGTTTIEDIQNLESEFDMSIPEDYKDFLMMHNGGKPDIGNEWGYAEFYVEDLESSQFLDILYGIGVKKLDISYWTNFFPGDIPPKTLVIGGDPGGAMLLLFNDNSENDGIYYYDHAYRHKQSSDEQNTYFVADTFTEFIALLKPPAED